MEEEQIAEQVEAPHHTHHSPKNRKRMKHLFNSIRQQMEFYFGDSNLSKDRYLAKKIQEDPFVPLDEFLKFNKIKALTDKVQHIAKAVSNSELLELSEDSTKIRRKASLEPKVDSEEVDRRTIYVEALPANCDHDWVKRVFEAYGPVSYVSLPRYKFSRKIKEFGFVEFAEEATIEKVMNAFQEFGGVIPCEETEPETLQSVISFQKEKEEDAKASTSDTDSEPPAKKAKKDENAAEETLAEGSKDAESQTETPEAPPMKKKKKKSKQQQLLVKEAMDKIFELRVMKKRDWKRLRNKYLNLQRERFKEIKRTFVAGRKQQEETKKKRTPTKIAEKAKGEKNVKINFYGAKQEPAPPPEAKKPSFSFEPGLIVNIKFREPCVDVKEFKTELKQFPYVKYIDLKEGDSETFIRVDKAISANHLVKAYASAEYAGAQILSGEVEQKYWAKIMQDRAQKLSKAVKVPQARGREKLSKKIASHIRFNDDE